jgi:hypothetical protein
MDDLRHKLLDEFRDGRVLVVVGAGVSLSATGGNPLAGWPGLLESGVERCRRRGATDAWVTLRMDQTTTTTCSRKQLACRR